ncbi:MAG: glycosyltransferase, partial [Bacteroidales bacterium]
QSLLLARELQAFYRTLLVVWESKPADPSYLRFIERYGLNVVYLRGPFPLRFFQLWRLLIREKVTHIFNFLLVNNLFGGLAARLARVPHIFGGIRNCELVRSKFLWQRFLHNHISHNSIFNNYAGARHLTERGFRPDKANVIHNGIDVNGMVPEKSFEGPVVILSAARFLPQKDYFTALKAITILKKAGYNFLYIIAGYGPGETDIRRWIEELGVEDRVRIEISPSDLPGLFARSHIYLSTSLKEGLSNSIMEAMAAGLPVVATDVGDNRYLVKDGVTGMLISRGNDREIADSLEKLLQDSDVRQEMGLEGYERLKSGFSTRQFLDNYLKVLNDA